MKTLVKPAMWKILELFYNEKNVPLHLRDIARKSRMNVSGASRFLKTLVKEGILKEEKDGSMRKFSVNKSVIPEIFPMFDYERIKELPLLRKNALKNFLFKLEIKPVFVIVFGSTAKKTFNKNSDIDLLIIFNSKFDTKQAEKYAESQTGIRLSPFSMNFFDFLNEIRLKEDYVIQSALETGFPIFNNKFYYETIYGD